MRLQTQLLVAISVVMSVAFVGLEMFSHQRIRKDVDREMQLVADQIRGVLMATRRIYHKQFLESEIPLTSKTLGFLPAHAMSRISKDFSEWSRSGISFNNVSDQPRNPDNLADPIEQEAIDFFRTHPESTQRWTDYFSPQGIPYRHFAWPIWTENYCLECHGPREKAPQTIREQYDTAFDYETGDLRGIMSIKVPAGELARRVQEDFLQNFIWHLAGFVALFLILGVLIRRKIIDPMVRLGQCLAEVEQGIYPKELTGLKGEFGRVEGAFNRMVRAIREKEEALRASQERFRSVAFSVADAILAINTQGRIIFWNRGAQAIFGFAESEIVEEEVTRIIPSHLRRLHLASMERWCQDLETPFPGRILELEGIRKSGECFPMEMSLSCWREGEERFFTAVIRDISGRKAAEEALERAHQEIRLNDLRLRSILDNTPAVIFLKDTEGRFILVNRSHEALFHIPIADIVGRTDHEVFPQAMADAFVANDLKVLESGQPWTGEENALLEDGVHTYHVIKFPLRNDQGEITGLCGIASDISERKRMEKELADLLELNRKIITDSPSGILAYKASGACVLANASAATIVGARVEDVLHQNFRQVPSWKRYGLLEAAESALTNGGTVHLDGQVITSFGRDVWLSYHFTPFTSNGEPHLLLLIEDITQRRQAEAALRESELKFRSLFDHAGDGILVANPKTSQFVMANATMARMTGYSVEELCTMGVEGIHPPEDLPWVRQEFLSIATHGGVNHNIPVLRKDGTVFRAEINAVPVVLDGKPFIVGMFRDITERMQLEEQLRQSRKLQAVGALSGGIAHNFNNILAIILGNAELGQMGISSPDEVLADIAESAKRGRELVRQLLAFSRRSPMVSHRPFDPGKVVREGVQFMRSALSPSLQIVEEIADIHGVILGDAAQFQQIVINLVTNAGHALGDRGGRIRVALSEVVLHPSEVMGMNLEAGEYFELEVQDHGPGMTPEIKERIFEPFFTTKEPGQGTGLGLSMVHGVVQDLQGTIVCNSAPGEGALFRILVPRRGGEAWVSPIQENVSRLPYQGRRGRVLFVDDEPVLINVGKKMLEILGFEAETYMDPMQALEAFMETPEDFCAVVTDQVMPEMTGLELSRRILLLRPDVPILLCTGFSDQVNEEKVLELGIRSLFMKPMTLHDLERAMNDLVRDGKPKA